MSSAVEAGEAAKPTAPTWANKLVELGKQRVVVLTGLITTIIGFWTTLALLPEKVGTFAPWIQEPWQLILLGVLLPLAIIGLVYVLPAWLQRRRDQRLKEWALRGSAEPGYFRLSPYLDSEKDRRRYQRADKNHEEVLDWLQTVEEPIVYLTGRSGSGKSSLLNAHVLPKLREGTLKVRTVTVRSFRNPMEALGTTLRSPGVIWKQPPNTLPEDLTELMGRVSERLSNQGERLLIVFDQFEEFLILLNRHPEQQSALLEWLQALQQKPIDRTRVLLTLRSDYLDDLARLDLPRLHDGVNWKQVGSFPEWAARDFINRSGLNLGPELVAAVVRHASELDETRGKVRPIVLNMLGRALEAKAGHADVVLSPREAQRLLLNHVRDGLNDPLARDRAPQLLENMITAEGTKEPKSVGELAGQTTLDPALIDGCLKRLELLGFVREIEHQTEAATPIWEVAHDFVARLLSLVLPGWQPSFWRRLRPWLGPLLMVLGILAVFGIVEAQRAEESAQRRRFDQLYRWVGEHNGDLDPVGDGTALVRFSSAEDFLSAWSDIYTIDASMITGLDLSYNFLSSVPDSLGDLSQLRSLDLSYNSLSSVPDSLGDLSELTTLNLDANPQLVDPPPEVVSQGTQVILEYLRNKRKAREDAKDNLIE